MEDGSSRKNAIWCFSRLRRDDKEYAYKEEVFELSTLAKKEAFLKKRKSL